MLSIRGFSPVLSACTSTLAGLLTAIRWLSSYRMGIRYPASSILFFFTREVLCLYILYVLLHCSADCFKQVQVLAQKARFKSIGDPQHVVDHQYLTIYLRAGADPDDRNAEHGRYIRRQFRSEESRVGKECASTSRYRWST